MSSAWETPLDEPHPTPPAAPPPEVGAWGTDAQEAEVEATSVAREAVARLESQLRRANAHHEEPAPEPTATGSIPAVAEELGDGPAPSIWPRSNRPPLLPRAIDAEAIEGIEASEATEAIEAEAAGPDEGADENAHPPDPAADQDDQIWPTGWWGENDDR
jgi:hypothetical protein